MADLVNVVFFEEANSSILIRLGRRARLPPRFTVSFSKKNSRRHLVRGLNLEAKS
jgi:hypothetical protein